jgi:hypothetical protein
MKGILHIIDDIVTGVVKVLDHSAKGNRTGAAKAPDPSSSPAHTRFIISVTNHRSLMDFIKAIEKLGKRGKDETICPCRRGSACQLGRI